MITTRVVQINPPPAQTWPRTTWSDCSSNQTWVLTPKPNTVGSSGGFLLQNPSHPTRSMLFTNSSNSGNIKLKFEEIWWVFLETGIFSRFRQFFFFFFRFRMLSSFRRPNPARPMLTLTWNQLDQLYGGSSLGSSALHPTPAGQVQVGSKPDSWTALITTKFVAKFCHI